MKTIYEDENGSKIFVSSGISNGEVFMTVRQKDGKTGQHRIKSKFLPLTYTPEEQQEYLDAYAKEKGWKALFINFKKISRSDASWIIGKRKPLGLFYTVESELFIGIDNSTGEAWTEEFKSEEECIRWLIGTK